MTKTYTLHAGNSREVLATFPDNSVDSIVTDPPYGLGRIPDINVVLRAWMAGEEYTQTGGGFMGKAWDSFIPGPEIWRECFRVLKPGGYILAFAGTRTQDVMALALRMAGFEIRDMIAWVYGSGFPKSMNVSKAIDKQDAVSDRYERAIRCTTWMRETGITAAQVNEITGSFMASHYLSRSSQPQVPTREHLELLRPHLPEIPQWVEDMVDQRIVASENFAARPVTGTAFGTDMSKATVAAPLAAQGVAERPTREYDITAANTPEAAEWEGWGTALKPALEPITLARKPFSGSVADNVLRHRTGALNIDGCRIGSDIVGWGGAPASGNAWTIFAAGLDNPGPARPVEGRWPANLIHDGSPEVSGLMGSAARFFYAAKASKDDRDEGLDALPEMSAAEITGRKEGSAGINAYAGATGARRNPHPTVKPTDLMRYLCRLITPPGGTVLDPFMGSGSTGKAAMLENFSFIGVDLDPEYVEIARARIEFAARQPTQTELF